MSLRNRYLSRSWADLCHEVLDTWKHAKHTATFASKPRSVILQRTLSSLYASVRQVLDAQELDCLVRYQTGVKDGDRVTAGCRSPLVSGIDVRGVEKRHR